jgi:small subunit ribosomal protein S17
MAKTLTGIVVSDKADKTIVISVVTHKIHPIYKKGYIVSSKFMSHDEKNDAKEGDKVTIAETKPISRRKRFTLVKVLERAGVVHVEDTPEIAKPKKAKKPAVVEAKDKKEEK